METPDNAEIKEQSKVAIVNVGGLQRHLNMVKYRHALRMAEYAAEQQEIIKKDIG